MILFNDDDENMDDLNIDEIISVDQVLMERDEQKAEPEQEANEESASEINQDLTLENTIERDIDSLLQELDEIERSLGMQTEFEDIEFPEFKPIILPPVQYPEPKVTKVDFAKLDDEQLDLIMRQFRKIDTMEAEVKALKEVIDERLNVDFRAMYENIMEKTNIEAIKTYRNVQAVIIEENAKQNQALFGIDNKSNSLKKRMNNVLIFAIVSFVVSILVMLVTILPAMGIKLF
ncbi:hypothetical protein SAMN04487830_10169 [Pseudobutyrivibrio sp. OR37]|uniref:hypothetical protein n=1 Tax=Pseudobutyrivibrio sp. OR37 TaxID=1798186 RepID=UPI0008EAB0CA|nr:hypothetical protein [Pseudobutyrivibrio sp. OR37]SFH52773.1 hypothetical protein SAMN04487830_10169 [Pseudobutyrivibrio sp. OR37]